MGLIHIEGTVTGPNGKQATLKFLLDSGATYTLLPQQVWRGIELEPMDSVKCILADGTEVERRVSECQIALPQGRRHTPVMLGEKDDEALLGVVTLEILGLILNPFSRTLQPMRIRAVVLNTLTDEKRKKGGILMALRRSPWVGADLALDRPVTSGRRIDL
ncbi:MAG: retroviral-like aspartic protease family protein [Terriglobia bacterium]